MPTCADTFNQAVWYHQNGELARAESLYRHFLQAEPDHAQAHYFLGVLAHQSGRFCEAISLLRQAITLNGRVADYHLRLGLAYKDFGNLPQAIICLQQALHLDPMNADAHNMLGITFAGNGQLAEAAECFRQVVRFNPSQSEAYNNLASALGGQGLLAEAAECFEQALRVDPSNKMALWNRCLLRLRRGDFESAWQDYELRSLQPGKSRRSFGQPPWHGSALAGKTLLIYPDGGLGDSIQFIRYAPLIKKRGGTVIFECQPPLAGLLNNAAGIDRLVAGQLPPFDVQVPLLSLPRLLGTTLSTIPAAIPYLTAEPQRVEYWSQELTRLAPRAFKIGVVWQGSMNQKDDRRSLSLSRLAPVARVENVRLVSLQVGAGTEQLAGVPFSVIDLGSRFDPNSLADLAAALVNMDLVITVDTAAAHLAGALGVPVWVLLPFVSCWRWLLERTDSPWYPTLLLFRQKQFDDWNEVIERVAAKAQSFVMLKRDAALPD